MFNKLRSLESAVASIPDGAVVALSGNTLHRAPCAAVHEMVRQNKRDLEVVKTAGSYDVDILAGAGCLRSVAAGFVGFENVFGLAPRYRKAVEEGQVQVKEHACYTVIAGLRAAIQGLPFMPVAGMFGSDLLAAQDFRTVRDPYSGADVVAVQQIRPDVALIHVQEADTEGNGRIVGTRFEDVLMVEAAKRVILTCERLVKAEELEWEPERTAIPGFLVESVVVAPRGAWPTSCAGEYDYDYDYLKAYVEAAGDDGAYQRFLDAHVRAVVPLAGAV